MYFNSNLDRVVSTWTPIFQPTWCCTTLVTSWKCSEVKLSAKPPWWKKTLRLFSASEPTWRFYLGARWSNKIRPLSRLILRCRHLVFFFSRDSYNLIPELHGLQTLISMAIVKKGLLSKVMLSEEGSEQKEFKEEWDTASLWELSRNKAQRHLPGNCLFPALSLVTVPPK